MKHSYLLCHSWNIIISWKCTCKKIEYTFRKKFCSMCNQDAEGAIQRTKYQVFFFCLKSQLDKVCWISKGILTLVQSLQKYAKSLALTFFLLHLMILHVILRMGLKWKYLLRLSHLYHACFWWFSIVIFSYYLSLYHHHLVSHQISENWKINLDISQ